MVLKFLATVTAPFVFKFMEKLILKSDLLGTGAGILKISAASSGSGTPQKFDRFIISFPYGAQNCKWQVIFDSNQPREPPDFIFLQGDKDFTPDYAELTYLHNWDSENPDSLFNAMYELIEKYKSHHLKLLKGTRVEYEFLSLTTCEDSAASTTTAEGAAARVGGDPEDVGSSGKKTCHDLCRHYYNSDIYVKASDGLLGPVQVAVRLSVDLSCFRDIFPRDNDGTDKVLVLVIYENPDGGSVSSQICASPRVERVFRLYGGVPSIPFPRESSLYDYITTVSTQVNETVNKFRTSCEKRKQYVLCLASTFSSYMVEYDFVNYSNVHLMVSSAKSPLFLVSVEIPLTFPTTQPTLVVSLTNQLSSSKTIRKYPYSPRWSAEEMSERLKTYLTESIPLITKEIERPRISPTAASALAPKN